MVLLVVLVVLVVTASTLTVMPRLQLVQVVLLCAVGWLADDEAGRPSRDEPTAEGAVRSCGGGGGSSGCW
jgi:hypothetical protein